MVQESSNEGDDGDVLIVCTTSYAHACVLGSRTSYHITHNRDCFESFKEWNGIVKMVDD